MTDSALSERRTRTPGKPSLRSRFRSWHKWVAVAAGIILLIWMVSGLAMLFPLGVPVGSPPGPVDYDLLRVSPQEAIVAAGVPASDVHAVTLTRIGDRVAYWIRGPEIGSHLVDAGTGSPFVIDEAAARRLVQSSAGEAVRVTGIRRIERHQLSYPRGPVPVYEVRFEGPLGPRGFVSAVNGRVFYGNSLSAVRTAVIAFHEFEPLRLLIPNRAVRLFMIVAGLLVLFVIASGYYLSLPRRRTRAPARDS